MSSYYESIINNISIVDFISKYTSLKKKGREYQGLCPFHGEKTPSFYVNPDKALYYCFGCQAKGNVFNFYMDYHSASYNEALEKLAEIAGIQIVNHYDDNRKNVYQVYYSAMEIAANSFFYNLSKNKEALKYLEQRKINSSSIEKFSIGYASNLDSNLFQQLEENKISNQILLELGLKGKGEDGSLYQFFRDRIIFPIKDVRGKIVGFGGRSLGNKLPKYLNSKESKIFHKKQILYGLQDSLRFLEKDNNLIVVEGYLDVISLHQEGVKTAVATLGTSITMSHLELIHKYDQSPVFCLDGDSAGYKSAMRIIDLYLEYMTSAMNPRFIFLSTGEDPDSYIHNQGKDAFNKMLKKAQSISEILLNNEIQGKDLTVPEIASQSFYALKSKVMSVKDNDLKNKLIYFFKSNTIYYISNKKVINNQNLVNRHVGLNVLDEEASILLFCTCSFPEIFSEIEEELGLVTFINPSFEKLRLFIMENSDKLNAGDISIFANLDDDIKSILKQLGRGKVLTETIIRNIENPNDALKQFNSIICNMEIRNKKDVLKTLEIKKQEIIKSDISEKEKQIKLGKIITEQKEILQDISSIHKQGVDR